MIVDTFKGVCRMRYGRRPLTLLPVPSSCCACSFVHHSVLYGLIAQRTDKAYVCCLALCRRKLGLR